VTSSQEGAHGGGQQFIDGSAEHQALLALFDLVDRATDPGCVENPEDTASYRDIVDRLIIQTPRQTFRAFTEQTLGRLPTAAEVRAIESAQPGRPGLPGPGQVTTDSAQLRVVAGLMNEAAQTGAYRKWLKDGWNDVFMFRGVYAQDLDRAYEAFAGWDYGARAWPDLVDRMVPLTDETGEFIDVEGSQPICNLLAERFNYRAVRQPHTNSNSITYSGQEFLSPEEACDYGAFSRNGIAYLMLYGAVEEPLELIAHTIQSGRPFTEILTSQDLYMNYYTSLVYFGTADPGENDFTADMTGVPTIESFRNGPNWVKFEVDMPDHRMFKRMTRVRRTNLTQVNSTFENTNAPIRELIYPAREDFPRAGILTSAAFLKRFASNDFNMHRHRSWQTMRLLLGYDVLGNQGERISLADFNDPNDGVTLTNQECAACHHKLDPVAGLFRDFYTAGHSRSATRADQDWPTNIHAPGFPADFTTDEVTPHDRAEHGPAIRFLADRIVTNPEFARTMVGYAWKQVLGNEPVGDLGDINDSSRAARSTLVIAQHRLFESLVNGFVRSDFDMARVYQRLFTSIWYRAKGLEAAEEGGVPDEVYGGVGRAGTLTPEEYFRRVEAVYGNSWPLKGLPQSEGRAGDLEQVYKRDYFTRTDSEYKNFDLHFGMVDASFSSFFGGIDFQNSLTRAEQINSVMSLVAARVANEFACLTVYADLKKAPRSRRFFPLLPAPILQGIGALPPEATVRSSLVQLFELFLGITLLADDAEVDRAYQLYEASRASVLAEIAAQPQTGPLMPAHCRVHEAVARGDQAEVHRDRDGQVRAWMAVVSYLMLQPEFLQR
jgi:hypothetical protein